MSYALVKIGRDHYAVARLSMPGPRHWVTPTARGPGRWVEGQLEYEVIQGYENLRYNSAARVLCEFQDRDALGHATVAPGQAGED